MPGTATPAGSSEAEAEAGTDRERALLRPGVRRRVGQARRLAHDTARATCRTAILVFGAWYFSRTCASRRVPMTRSPPTSTRSRRRHGAEAWAVLNTGLAVVGALSLVRASTPSGSVRPLFAAVPDRTRVVLAKAAALGVVGVAAGLAASVSALAVSQRELSANRLDMALTDPVAVRAAAVSAVFPAVAALIGLAVGALLRHEAAAALGAFAVSTVLPSLFRSDALALPARGGPCAARQRMAGTGQRACRARRERRTPAVGGSPGMAGRRGRLRGVGGAAA
ncbi:hypothetical protein ACU686_20385 [Yinghuangia aomiensis]